MKGYEKEWMFIYTHIAEDRNYMNTYMGKHEFSGATFYSEKLQPRAIRGLGTNKQ